MLVKTSRNTRFELIKTLLFAQVLRQQELFCVQFLFLCNHKKFIPNILKLYYLNNAIKL